MRMYDVVEKLEGLWPFMPKDNVIVKGNTSEAFYVTECGNMRLYHAVHVHSRVSIRESIIVLDSSHRVMADRILFYRLCEPADSTMLDSRRKAPQREDSLQFWVSEMQRILGAIQVDRAYWEIELGTLVRKSTGTSVSTLQGGSTGLVQTR